MMSGANKLGIGVIHFTMKEYERRTMTQQTISDERDDPKPQNKSHPKNFFFVEWQPPNESTDWSFVWWTLTFTTKYLIEATHE